MPKGQRIIVFLATLALLLVGYIAFKSPMDVLNSKGILIISALIMLSFTTLLAEHFFTRPTDVVASAVSILLLLSPLHSELNEMGLWYWIIWGYSAALLVVSLAALLILSPEKSPSARINRVSAILKTIAIRFGNGRFLWFSFFVLCVLFYVDSQSPLFIALFAYAAVLLLVDPKKAIISFNSVNKQSESAVAELFGIQSSSAYLAKVYPDSPPINRFDVAGFVSNSGGRDKWIAGLVIEAYELNEQRWIKILTDESFGELKEKTTAPKSPKKGVVHLLNVGGELALVSHLVGTVCEGTTIEKLRFEYAFNVRIQEGELLQVCCGVSNVLYQVVEGTTGSEILESRNEAGFIIGEAVQLGIWNAENRSFDRYGWVPSMNSPVSKAETIDIPDCLPNEYQIGSIPSSNFPVFIDRESAVTHHLAILGVTGSGKSVFARDLIRQIADEDAKVICVDFTNEYKEKLADLIGSSLVEGQAAEDLFSAIDTINEQMDEFANKRDKLLISQKEGELRNGFKAALQSFVANDEKAVLFELPDVTNTAGILEFTKWFFKSLFELAKASELNGKKVCVVLEEAHTIVPEWNFLGVDDKRSSSVVNSIAQIALQGRKYGVGFIVIGQRTANISKTVLTQCNSVVAFQQFDRTSAEFLGNYMSSDYVASLTRLKPRHAIAVGKAFSSGTPMIFSVPEIDEPQAHGG
ncbi:ATP-binding protein [Aidingimonas lacisalsi]|uniref:ATP-binding protein n=1 Tax=Aidingimonas lacisalsi TaxID=2604086 RepID=UPI0011D2192B|nr:ATP-binding protein [Aidingimonas lacisalsi]